jgi:hypothetical protein
MVEYAISLANSIVLCSVQRRVRHELFMCIRFLPLDTLLCGLFSPDNGCFDVQPRAGQERVLDWR